MKPRQPLRHLAPQLLRCALLALYQLWRRVAERQNSEQAALKIRRTHDILGARNVVCVRGLESAFKAGCAHLFQNRGNDDLDVAVRAKRSEDPSECRLPRRVNTGCEAAQLAQRCTRAAQPDAQLMNKLRVQCACADFAGVAQDLHETTLECGSQKPGAPGALVDHGRYCMNRVLHGPLAQQAGTSLGLRDRAEPQTMASHPGLRKGDEVGHRS